jgi:hypothetical protein
VKQIRVETEINTSAAAVDRILFDFPSYPEWNPFIRKMEGQAVAGGRLHVRLEPPGGMGMSFSPRVLEAGEGRIRWLGRLLSPGVVDGEHTLQVEARGEDRAVLIQSERFSGLLVPFLGGTLRKTRAGFEAMNLALKARAEAAGDAGAVA